MDCDAIRKRLSEHLDGEVPAGDLPLFERHLVACEACRKELAALRRVSAELGRLERRKAPAHLAGAIRDRIARDRLLDAETPARKRPLRLHPWLKGMGLAAAAMLVLLLGNPLSRKEDLAPEEPASEPGWAPPAERQRQVLRVPEKAAGRDAPKPSAGDAGGAFAPLPPALDAEAERLADQEKGILEPSERMDARAKRRDDASREEALRERIQANALETEDKAPQDAQKQAQQADSESALRKALNLERRLGGGQAPGAPAESYGKAKKESLDGSAPSLYRFRREATDEGSPEERKAGSLDEIVRHPALLPLRPVPAGKKGGMQGAPAASGIQSMRSRKEHAAGETDEDATNRSGDLRSRDLKDLAAQKDTAKGRSPDALEDLGKEDGGAVVLEGEVTEEELSAIRTALREAGFALIETPGLARGTSATKMEEGAGAPRRRIRIVLEIPPER